MFRVVCCIICMAAWVFNGVWAIAHEGTEWKTMRYVWACFMLAILFATQMMYCIFG